MDRKKGALRTLQVTNVGNSLAGKATIKSKLKPTDLNQTKENSDSKVSVESIGCETDKKLMIDVEQETEVTIAVHSEPDTDASMRQMLLASHPNERYWELVAEARREALDEALKENLQMAQQIGRLKEENRMLQFMADEGKQYAQILKECLEENEDAENDKESEN